MLNLICYLYVGISYCNIENCDIKEALPEDNDKENEEGDMEEDLDLGTFGDKKKKKKKKKLDLEEVIGEEEDKENEGGQLISLFTGKALG